jgi:hypothetical protein
MGRESGSDSREFKGAVAEAPRLGESAEEQTGATQRVVAPAEMANGSARRLTLEEVLCFLEAIQCLAGIVELRQDPRR